MAARLYINNYRTATTLALTDIGTSMTVSSVTGVPAISGGDWLILTLTNGVHFEIVKATAISTNTFTIDRAEESTTARDWPAGTVVFMAATAASWDSIGGGTPGGSTTEVQFNNAGAFDGISTLTTDGTDITLTSGALDLGGATSLELPNSSAPTVNATGEIALDTTVTDYAGGLIKYYSGGVEYALVAMPAANFTSPTDTYTVTYDSTSDAFELAAGGGGGGGAPSGGPDSQTIYTTMGSPTTLTVADDYQQIFNSGVSETVLLPVTSTLALGRPFLFYHIGGGANLTIQSSGGNTVKQIQTGMFALCTMTDTGHTTAADWTVNVGYLNEIFTGTTNQIVIDTSAKVFSLSDDAVMPGNGGMVLPSGGTGSRGSNVFGRIRSNTSTGFIEYNDGSSWWSVLSTANPVTVAQGGTGVATTTAYSVLCAGTTATGAFQSLAALGNAGSRLTSAGAGALPSFKGGLTCFLAQRGSAQTLTTATFTKVQFNTETIDTGGYYDNATNYRYTPLVAGYYLVFASLLWDTSSANQRIVNIYKNGAAVNGATFYANTNYAYISTIFLVQMNGSTDYLEVYGYHDKGSNADILGTASQNIFGAILVEPT